MEGGKEQNFWPGFVDALSNVVLVMIFVVVVFVVTLFYYSQKLAQAKIAKIVQSQESGQLSGSKGSSSDGKESETARLKSQNQNQTQEIDTLRQQVATLKTRLAEKSTSAAPGSMASDAGAVSNNIEIRAVPQAREVAPGVKVDGNAKAVVLNFENDSTELNDEAAKALDSNIGDWVRRAKAQQGKIVVTGVVGSAEFSEGRRRAYYRTIAVRNRLLDAGVPADRVQSRVAAGENTGASAARVILQFAAAGK